MLTIAHVTMPQSGALPRKEENLHHPLSIIYWKLQHDD